MLKMGSHWDKTARTKLFNQVSCISHMKKFSKIGANQNGIKISDIEGT